MEQEAESDRADFTPLLLSVGPALLTFQQSTVAISHFNALGAEIARQLVSMGLSRLLIHADDGKIGLQEIEESVLFLPGDVGLQRRQTICHRLRAINPTTEITWTNNSITACSLPRSSYFVVTGPDSLDSLLSLNEECRKYDIRLLVGLVSGVFGVVFEDFGLNHSYIGNYTHTWPSFMLNECTVDQPGRVKVMSHNFDSSFHFIMSPRMGFSTTGCISRECHNIIDENLFLQLVDESWVERRKEVERKLSGKLFEFSRSTEDRSVCLVDDPDGFLAENLEYIRACYVTSSTQQTSASPISSFKWLQATQPCLADHDIVLSEFQLHANLATYVSYLQHLLKVPTPLLESSLFQRLQRGGCRSFAPTINIIGGVISKEILKLASGVGKPLQQWFFFDAPILFPDWLSTPSDSATNNDISELLTTAISQAKLTLVGELKTQRELGRLLGHFQAGTAPESRISLIPSDLIRNTYATSNSLIEEAAQGRQQIGEQILAEIAQSARTPLQVKNCHIFKRIEYSSYVQEAWKSDAILDTLVQNGSTVIEYAVFFKVPIIIGGGSHSVGNTWSIVPGATGDARESYFPDGLFNFFRQVSAHSWPTSSRHCVNHAVELVGKLSTDTAAATLLLRWAASPALIPGCDDNDLMRAYPTSKLLLELANIMYTPHTTISSPSSSNCSSSTSDTPMSSSSPSPIDPTTTSCSPSIIDISLDSNRRLRLNKTLLEPFIKFAVFQVQDTIELRPQMHLNTFPIDHRDNQGNLFWKRPSNIVPRPRVLDFEDPDVVTAICFTTVIKAIWSGLVFVPEAFYVEPSSSSSREAGEQKSTPSPESSGMSWALLNDAGHLASALKEHIIDMARRVQPLTLHEYALQFSWNGPSSRAHLQSIVQAAVANPHVVQALSGLIDLHIPSRGYVTGFKGHMWLLGFQTAWANLISHVYGLGIIHPLDILEFKYHKELMDPSTIAGVAGFMMIELAKILLNKHFAANPLAIARPIWPQDHNFSMVSNIFQSSIPPPLKPICTLKGRAVTMWEPIEFYLPKDCSLKMFEKLFLKQYELSLEFLSFESYMVGSVFTNNPSSAPIRRIMRRRCNSHSISDDSGFTVFIWSGLNPDGTDVSDTPPMIVHWLPSLDKSAL